MDNLMAWSIAEDLLFLVRAYRAGAIWQVGPGAYREILAIRDWNDSYIVHPAPSGLTPSLYGLPIAVAPSLPERAIELHDASGQALARIPELGVSEPCVVLAPPLIYDPAIYWAEPCHYCEYRIDQHCIQDARLDAREYARRCLRRLAAAEARKADWIAYTTVEQERSERYTLIIRHSLYEQPGFTEIHRYTGPPHIQQFRIQPQGGAVVTLDLRRLMYRGERARGALHGTELYVFLPAIAPEQQGGPGE